MKKIISLTNVFVKEFYQNLDVFDSKEKKFNKKSVFFWLIAIVFLGVAYVSYEVIKFLVNVGQPEIFLNIYFFVLAVLFIFQTILACASIFFFSKDIENVLHMPIKPVELLLAKLNTLLCMLYATEAIFTIVPLTLYGLITQAHFLFYFWEIITLAIFPILIAVVISILMLIIMRFGKFIKNKNVFQIIITLMMVAIVCIFEFKAAQGLFDTNSSGEQAISTLSNMSEKSQNVNKYFLIVNPTINMLVHPYNISAVKSFLQIVLYNIIGIAVFVFIGRITYLKDILRNITSYTKKKIKKVNMKKQLKLQRTGKSYIIKEINNLTKTPIFFMQCVLPVIIILITCVILGIYIVPIITELMQNEEIQQAMSDISFNTEGVCYILIILQVLFSISNISLTAISREGKDALFIKYIPVELYKQFIYKCVPQFVLNLLVTIIVLGVIWYLIPVINFIYIILMFIIATAINLINCYLMLIVDLRRPNLNWDTEYAVVKNSDNKFFQYAFMIINILFLMYIAKILKDVDILISLGIEIAIFILIFIVIDRCVKKWQRKLFNKIN